VPTPPSADYSDDLLLALRMADAADAITMARFGAIDLVVDAKPDLTPVSDADQAVERAIRAQLVEHRAGDALLGEEFGAVAAAGGDQLDAGPQSRRRWVIDPIDGTKNYVRTVPVWATLIGLLDADEAVVGVVSAPALGRRWWAARGQGAWAAALGAPARRIRVSSVNRLDDASLSYASLDGWADHGKLDAFVSLTRQVWRSRAYGDFWSYMLVAEGAVDLAAEPELAVWDMTALAPVVTEAGGSFTGLDGVPGPLRGNVAASNGLLHDALLAALG
jgi:histidinol-phosphatase